MGAMRGKILEYRAPRKRPGYPHPRIYLSHRNEASETRETHDFWEAHGVGSGESTVAARQTFAT